MQDKQVRSCHWCNQTYYFWADEDPGFHEHFCSEECMYEYNSWEQDPNTEEVPF